MLRGGLVNKSKLLFFILYCSGLLAQKGLQSIVVKHPFQTLTARTGYQQMHQNSNGWFYIATTDGIILYDGVNESFILNSEQIAEHPIQTIAELADGSLLFGSRDGFVFLLKDRIFSTWQKKDFPIKVAISRIVEDNQKFIWIATKGEGVYLFNHKHWLHFGQEDGLNDLNINDMVASHKAGVLVASDRGFQSLLLVQGKKQCNSIYIQGLPEKDIIQHLVKADNNYIINSLSKGPLVWNPENNALQSLWSHWNKQNILKLAVIGKQTCILTDHSYLFGFENNEFTEGKDPEVGFSAVVAVIVDKMKNIWILHKSKGLFSIYTPIIQYALEGKNIQALYLGKNSQTLFVGTTQGLICLDVKTGIILKNRLNAINVNAIYPSIEAEWLWIATYGNGLIYYNYLTDQQIRLTKNQGLPDNNLLQITSNKDFIWVSTLGGIFRMKNARPSEQKKIMDLVVYTQNDLLPTNFVYQIMTDSLNNLYVATDGFGTYLLEAGQTTFKPFISELSNSSILSLERINFNKWIINATKKGIGIYSQDEKQIHWIHSDLRYGGFESTSLLNDSVLLAASIGYLTIINLNNEYSLTLDEELGLADMRPSVNAIYKDPNGNAWIACQDKIYKINTDVVNGIQSPELDFSKIQQFEKYLRPDQDTVFKSNQNQFTFEFVALHYLATDHIQYRYMLLGYEKFWHLSKEGKASFSNLPSGKFKLIVQASTDKTFTSSRQIQYAFTIKSPYWKRWWFIGILSTLFVISFRTFMHYREKQRLKADETKRKTAELEFELLKNQVNPHFLFNSFNSLIALIEENPKKAIEFTDKLSDYFRNMLYYRDHPLIDLKEEIKLLQNYYDLLKLRFPENIHMKLIGSSIGFKIAPLTLQLLLENAIKHNDFSYLKPMHILVDISKSGILFKNTLNRKKSKEDSTGFGLESIRIRYQLLTDQSISVTEDAFYFTVIIPTIN